jgi:tRNA (guanine-N7-)-methyltransferase
VRSFPADCSCSRPTIPGYWSYLKGILPAFFDFHEQPGPWPDDPEGRTLREIVARSKGLTILRAQARKLELDGDELERRVAALPEPDFDANKPGYEGGDARAPRRHARRRR